MSDLPYTPFGLTDAAAEEYRVLRSELGKVARQSVIGWLRERLQHPGSGGWAQVDLARDTQLHTEVWLGIGPNASYGIDTVVQGLHSADDLGLLKTVDYLLTKSGVDGGPIEQILQASRSKWRVGVRDGRPGLVDRVPEGVQTAAEALFTQAPAGRVLARAWIAVRGMEKSPSAAYADAVRAVEIVAVTTVQPRNESATLGTVLGQMKTDGDWTLPLRQHPEAPSPDLILGMLRTLWFGHRDRHGKADYSDVTEAEALAAVALAVTLVDWFSAGAVARGGASVAS